MKIFVNFLVLLFVLPCFAQQEIDTSKYTFIIVDTIRTDTSDLKKKKVRKEKFVDYFNLMPKAVRDYTPSEFFADYENQTINNIEIFIVDRFESPVYEEENLDEVKTVENKRVTNTAVIVRKQLLFMESDKVDPQLIADTERNIRENTIYKDAVIKIETTPHIGGVNIKVYAHDNRHWKATFWATPTSLTMGGQFYDFFGVSQKTGFYGTGLIDPNNPYSVGAYYKVSNIAKSQISFQLDFNRQNLSQTYGFDIERDFFAYNTKWAGKVAFSNEYHKIEYNNIDNKYNNKYLSSEIWLARSFPLKKMNIKRPTMRMIVSARGLYRNNYQVPENQPAQNFVNKQIYLGSIGLANRDWYGFEELYRFRQFDYVPKGYNMAVISGYEINDSLGGRIYGGLTMNYSRQYPKFGFLQSELSLGSYVRSRKVEQISIQIVNSYFTNKAKLGKLGFRQFLTTNTTLSFNRPNSEFYNIGQTAIKGFDSQKMIGTKSFVLNLESVFYTNIDWWTSTGNFFFFADLGLIGRSNTDFLFDNALFQGYGAGIRFQNLTLGVQFLEISVGYYPSGYIVQERNWGFQIGDQLPRVINENSLFTPGIINDIY